MDFEAWKTWGGAALLRSIGVTLRIETRGNEHLRRMKSEGQPVLYAFFHGSLFPLVYVHRHQGVCILTSLSRDGNLLSGILLSMGYQVVRGSSSRGGIRGLLEMTRLVSKGFDGGVAVDGPRGPRLKVKPGVLLLSGKTGFPIVPIGVGFSRGRCFRKSWDEFTLPYPFSRVVLCYGEPFYVKGGLDGQEIDLERRLSAVMTEAKEHARRN